MMDRNAGELPEQGAAPGWVSAPMTFVQLFAHDVRHSLRAALAGADMLAAQGPQLDAATTAMLQRTVVSGLEELERTLENVLDLEHIALVERSAGERIQVDELVREAIEAIDPAAHQLHAEVVPVAVWGSDVLLRRAITNLVRNAIIHTPIGTDITVRVKPDATHDRSFVRIEVEDDGPGIERERREQVFDAFERGAKAPAQPGLGLGLTLVRRIARLHDGDAWVEDGPGSGVRVVFRVGVDRRSRPRDGCPDTANRQASSGPYLIVDPDDRADLDAPVAAPNPPR